MKETSTRISGTSKIKIWEYMQSNIYSWVKFVEDHGNTLSELVLVTGFHKTSYWAVNCVYSPVRGLPEPSN
jgi:hypothetical protein